MKKQYSKLQKNILQKSQLHWVRLINLLEYHLQQF